MPSSLDQFSLLTLALTVLVAGVAGLARGFSGFGAALIFMPAGSALVGPAVAAPVLLVADGVLSLGFLPRAWVLARRRDVALMASGAVIGVPLGAYVLRHSDPLLLRWVIAGLASSMLLLLVSGWRYHGTPRAPVTAVVGAGAGRFGGRAEMTGPPFVGHRLSRKETHGTMRASIILFFGATTVFTFISYLASGIITVQTLWLAAMVAPAYALGLFTGARAFHFASPAIFRRLCFALIAASVLTSLPVWR